MFAKVKKVIKINGDIQYNELLILYKSMDPMDKFP